MTASARESNFWESTQTCHERERDNQSQKYCDASRARAGCGRVTPNMRQLLTCESSGLAPCWSTFLPDGIRSLPWGFSIANEKQLQAYLTESKPFLGKNFREEKMIFLWQVFMRLCTRNYRTARKFS